VLSAGASVLSFNCFFAFNASFFVISSFLINLVVILAFSLALIFLSIYACDIGFDTLLTFNNSDGLNFLVVPSSFILYPSFLSTVYVSLLNLFFPLANSPLSSNTLTWSDALNGIV
jgi:hypothetical protein